MVVGLMPRSSHSFAIGSPARYRCAASARSSSVSLRTDARLGTPRRWRCRSAVSRLIPKAAASCRTLMPVAYRSTRLSTSERVSRRCRWSVAAARFGCVRRGRRRAGSRWLDGTLGATRSNSRMTSRAPTSSRSSRYSGSAQLPRECPVVNTERAGHNCERRALLVVSLMCPGRCRVFQLASCC